MFWVIFHRLCRFPPNADNTKRNFPYSSSPGRCRRLPNRTPPAGYSNPRNQSRGMVGELILPPFQTKHYTYFENACQRYNLGNVRHTGFVLPFWYRLCTDIKLFSVYNIHPVHPVLKRRESDLYSTERVCSLSIRKRAQNRSHMIFSLVLCVLDMLLSAWVQVVPQGENHLFTSAILSTEKSTYKMRKTPIKSRFFVDASFLCTFSGGECGIRTHEPVRATWFRVRLVMTTSITLRVFIFNISPQKHFGKRRELMERTRNYSIVNDTRKTL